MATVDYQRQRVDRRQRPRPAGSGRRENGGRTDSRWGQCPCTIFNDNMVLKFTQEGKFLMQIGKPGQSKGSNDIENLGPGKTLRRRENQ